MQCALDINERTKHCQILISIRLDKHDESKQKERQWKEKGYNRGIRKRLLGFFMHLNNFLWSFNEFVLCIMISLPVSGMKGRSGVSSLCCNIWLAVTESRLNINLASDTLTHEQISYLLQRVDIHTIPLNNSEIRWQQLIAFWILCNGKLLPQDLQDLLKKERRQFKMKIKPCHSNKETISTFESCFF